MPPLPTLFHRDLTKLQSELTAFKNEADIWRTTGSIRNTAGNLCLHLVGNLKTYIGKNLGNHPYLRDRDAEFSQKNIPRERLLQMLEETKGVVTNTLEELKEEQLKEVYPENVLGHEMTTEFFLIHLLAHLSYHLGQVNYLRRALDDE